ncbi:hypothetical protein HIM_01811 [Hirsutella minnesotensis 3608]|nr:hypothetical protein HIM_01811 [Hirsutella minnesotensis 3608]
MTGLIPLALPSECAANRRSVLLSSDSSSMSSCTVTAAMNSRPTSLPPVPSSRPKLFLRRPLARNKPVSPAPLRVMPSTAAQWKAALAEVKRAYQSGHYEQCSTRCQEILDYAHDMDVAEPAYLVYLGFYAATALESQAQAQGQGHLDLRHRQLVPRQRRLALLERARSCYRAASDLAARHPDETSSSSSRTSSPMPSLRSSVSSELSWSPVSTRMSSPEPSLCWSDERLDLDTEVETPVAVSAKPKKRVSFREVPTTEPLIRPDSPTLGFDDWMSPSPSCPFSPEPILKHDRSSFPVVSELAPRPVARYSRQLQGSEEPVVRPASTSRYQILLGGIQLDLFARIHAVDAEIAACRAIPVTQDLHDDWSAQDLEVRIKRLRARDWRRPRFDPERYQTLRENALADLAKE